MQNYHIKNHITLEHPIVEARLDGENIFLVDSKNILYLFDNKFNLKLKMKLDKEENSKHIFSNEYSISNKTISVAIEKTLVSTQYSEEKKIKPTYKSTIHQNSINFTRYSKDAKYLLSASLDGKVFIHDLETKTIRYSYKNRPDYASYATFSHTSKFVFVAYFNSTNTLLNLQDDTLIEFKSKDPIELAIFFDSDRKLFLVNREGYSIIYDCIEKEFISQKVLFTHWPCSATLSQNKKNIVIGTRTNKLYILDPFKNELIDSLGFEDSAVGKVDIRGDNLLIGFTNGSISLIDLGYKKEQFLHHIKLKEYDKAKEVLDINSFLYLDDAMDRFKKSFEEVLVKAKELITKKFLDKAIELVNPFMHYKEFKAEVDALLMQQDHIALFIEAVEKKNIQNAYFLAQKYPIIESLHYYTLLENRWERSYAQARLAIEEDPLRGVHKAKNILNIYEKTPQKSELIKFLLNNSIMLNRADVAIKKQDFKTYFRLVEEFDFLKETKLYKKITALAISIKNRATQLYADGDYRAAQERYRTILDFKEHREFALKEIEKIDHILRFQFAIEKGNKKLICSFASKYNFLSFTPEFENFNKEFDRHIDKAQKVAKYGDVKKARYILHEYIGIKELEQKIDNCIKIGYLKQFEDAETNSIAQDLFLKRYYFLFGIDNLLEATMVKKSLSALFKEFCEAPTILDVKKYPDSLHI